MKRYLLFGSGVVLLALAVASMFWWHPWSMSDALAPKNSTDQTKEQAQSSAQSAKVEAKNTDTIIYASSTLYIESLDPAWIYDGAGFVYVFDVYEQLVAYDTTHMDRFVPILATTVPSTSNGLIRDGGLTYVFPIRQGVRFQEGGELTPSDVQYSFERQLIQDRAGGASWLLLEPLFGVTNIEDLVQQKLKSVEQENPKLSEEQAKRLSDRQACEAIKQAIEIQDDSVVFRLKEPYIPFVAIMANPWFGYVVNKKWVVAQGEWDGSCETWRKFHNPKAQDSELYKKMNGTGPFKFEHWIPDQEVSLVRNDNYWRGMPDCVQYNKKEECTGPTKLQRVVTKAISEWSTRLLMLQSGDADWVYIPLPNWDQIQPMINDGRLTVYKDLPTLGQSVWYFAWNVNASNNPYIGSGKLDGQGIPPDFFSDIHIRKAFAQAFDVEKYIREVLRGDAVFARGLIIPSVFGHNPNQENYRFNLEQATQHFKQAWNGEVWKKGFKVVVTLTPGSVEGRAGYEMLKKAIESINPQFHIEIQEITDAQSIEDWNADRVPFGGNGWYEDFHDPHSWVQSYLYSKGYFGIRRHLPSDLQTKIDDLVIRARKELDPEKRKQLYYELQRINYEAVIIVPTSEAVSRFALRSWVQGYFYNPLGLTSDYYLWKR